jgi:rubrerythrin
MNSTGQVPARVRSLDELLAVAQALEQEAASRYRTLSARMALQGDTELAARFEHLASLEDRHVSNVRERSRALLGHMPDATRVRWDLPANHDEEEARGAALSSYQALAFAVRNEERAFAFYTYVAAEADHADLRALAEDLARDELQHAALLRRHRRRAFHDERPVAIERPKTIDALRTLAGRWDAEAAAAHMALAITLDAEEQIEDAAIFRRLGEQEAATAEPADAGTGPILRSAVDGLRLLEELFDRYVLIGGHADNELVVAEAQRLASVIIARLALAGGARRNTLLG